jgi:hypothetical protein
MMNAITPVLTGRAARIERYVVESRSVAWKLFVALTWVPIATGAQTMPNQPPTVPLPAFPPSVSPLAPAPVQQAQKSDALPCVDPKVDEIHGSVLRLISDLHHTLWGVVLESGVTVQLSPGADPQAMKAAHVGNHVRAFGQCVNRTEFIAQRLVTDEVHE